MLTEVGVRVVDAARDADTRHETRWVHAELVQRAARIAEEIAEFGALHERMLASGLSPHALAAPAIPLVLKSDAPPFMPIDATLAGEPITRRLGQ
jgi:hypothetical protein